MYDMTKIINRTWEIIFIDGEKLHILLPTIEEKMHLSELGEESTINSLIKAVECIVNRNKEQKVYSEEYLRKIMTEDNIIDFISNYTNWIEEVSDEKN